MNRKKNAALVMAGVLAGTMLTGPAAHAAEAYLKAYHSYQTIYLDGQRIELEAYTINGSNYVKLRDIGEAVGFNVYWDGAVRIDSDAPYTGEAPAAASTGGTVTLPTDGSRYIPQAGDVIACDDGTEYTITDVSRWDKNMFASGPAGELPEATAIGAASRRWSCRRRKLGTISWRAATTCLSATCMRPAGCSTR